jgi:hypothetical protein
LTTIIETDTSDNEPLQQSIYMHVRIVQMFFTRFATAFVLLRSKETSYSQLEYVLHTTKGIETIDVTIQKTKRCAVGKIQCCVYLQWADVSVQKL